ncbi:PREDICTED: fibropellin-3-like, partial [Priapulus caudatus]|uniref:Fibropellin-3-like n=1 Tax=Priapulus caudatus TaxID=37621 RepID=A0ABM1F2S9_PRICU
APTFTDGACDDAVGYCLNGGTCIDTIPTCHKCNCEAGWIGVDCEINDPCLPNPCQNEGTCTLHPANDGTYQCDCPAGYTGDNCEQSACLTYPCVNGDCHLVPGSETEATCICFEGWTGDDCSANDPCDPDPCENGQCLAKGGAYTCQCDANYVGVNCNVENPCLPINSPCAHGNCDLDDEFLNVTCICDEGYTGEACDIKEACSDVHNLCGDFGICRQNDSFPDVFTCDCFDGYVGALCNVSDPCNGIDCNYGVCEVAEDDPSEYLCVCETGYTGEHCEIELELTTPITEVTSSITDTSTPVESSTPLDGTENMTDSTSDGFTKPTEPVTTPDQTTRK